MLHKNLKPQTKMRPNLLTQKVQQKRITNLKQRHQLLLEDTDDYLNKLVHKSSATEMDCKNKETDESIKNEYRNRDSNKDRKDNPVNFNINLTNLKNLNISSQHSRKIYMSQHLIKEQNVQITRKSIMLRNIPKDRKGAMRSYQHNNKSLSKIYENSSLSKNHFDITNNKSNHKGKLRYQVTLDEKDFVNEPMRSSSYNTINKSIYAKKNNFKRVSELKDKSFIDGYLKGKQLGRGGFSRVWEAFNFKSKSFFAVKEIDTQNKYQTHLTQIWFGNHFFQNGKPKQQFTNHPGIKNLLTMFTYSIVDPRAFIVYQTCDGSLGSMLYDIYEEEDKDEEEEDDRLYMIKYKNLYGEMRKSTKILKALISAIAQALNLLIQNQIVHSDIKTENILLKCQQRGIKFKLIDYGSSFQFQSLKQYKLATPEYMCPELLNYLLFENKGQHCASMLQYAKDYSNISGIDVWGLGCVILELIHGLPLWMTNPTKILISGKYQTKKGLFAVSDRSFAKILERQLYVVQNLDHFLVKNNNSGILIDESIKKVLKGMLNPNPLQRIRPHEIINQFQQD